MDLTPEMRTGAAQDPQTTIVLRPARAKWFGILAICLVFTAIGAMMVRDGVAAGWFALGVFGLGAIVAGVVLLPGSAYLKVRSDGFVFGTLFRHCHLPWTAVGPFSVARVAGADLVVFDIINSTQVPRMAALSTALAGANAGLPDTYGMTAGELAGLLNAARDRALARASMAG